VDSRKDFPLVSVLMITYNHELYIGQAIEGVLMQRVDFKLELVIGEDCSLDSTRAICERYAEHHPGKIRLLSSERNHGMMPNFLRTLKACNGKYIATCEGDDYWTDPLKLQKQVDFLERNKKFSGVFHNVLIINENLPDKIDSTTVRAGIYNQKEIYLNNVVPTLSLVFCNKVSIPQWLSKATIGDWYLHILNTNNGPYYCLNDIMGVYRKTTNGAFSGLDMLAKARARLEFYKNTKDIIDKGLKSLRRQSISGSYFQVASYEKRTPNKIKYFLLSLWYNPFHIKKIAYRFKILFL